MEEQNNDTQPGLYANQADWSHTGWQSLLASFAAAFKAGLTASEMTTPNGEVAIGALWYKTVLQSTQCPIVDQSAPEYQYSVKPNGFDSGTDQLNWAVVLPPSASEMSIRAISGGQILSSVPLQSGLNYGAATGLQKGQQRLELIDSSGDIVLAASGGRCVSDNCPDCIYNMNPQVVALAADKNAAGPCPDQSCLNPDGTIDPPTIYYPPDLWSSANPVVSCQPPCTIVLPPYPLGTTTTVTWPPFYTTFLSSSNGGLYTMTTVLTVAEVITTEIELWSIFVYETDTTEVIFFPEQSVMPDSYTITLAGTEATFEPSAYPGNTVSSSTSSTLLPVFPGTSYIVTVQPQPTVSMTLPPPTMPAVTYTPGQNPSSSTYLVTITSNGETQTQTRTAGSDSQHSTKNCSKLFGCGCDCGLFACDGGAGIFGLGGGCGLHGCGGGCGGSTVPYASGSSGSRPTGPAGIPPPPPPPPPPNSTPDDSCASSTTVSMCAVDCEVTDFVTRTVTGCYSTTCSQTVVACEATGTVTTAFSTTTVACPATYAYTPWYTNLDEAVPTDVGFDVLGTWTSPMITSPPAVASSTLSPYPYTFTDPMGDVVGCNSVSTAVYAGYSVTVCVGSTSTIYTAPNPYPYTYTDIYGDVIGCQTSGVDNINGGSITFCEGSSTTLYTAPTPTTSTPVTTNVWGWYQQQQVTIECV